MEAQMSILACWLSTFSSKSFGISPFLNGLPQEYSPSGHGPLTQPGPAFSKRIGDTCRTSSSISHAIFRISHWARLQHLSEKKCVSSRAFIVTVMFVLHAFGNT